MNDERLPEVLSAAGLCMMYAVNSFSGFEEWLRSRGYVRDEQFSQAFLIAAAETFKDLVQDIQSEFLFQEIGMLLQESSPPQELPWGNGHGVASAGEMLRADL